MIIYKDDSITVFKAEDAIGDPIPDGILKVSVISRGYISIANVSEDFFEDDKESCIEYLMKFHKESIPNISTKKNKNES